MLSTVWGAWPPVPPGSATDSVNSWNSQKGAANWAFARWWTSYSTVVECSWVIFLYCTYYCDDWWTGLVGTYNCSNRNWQGWPADIFLIFWRRILWFQRIFHGGNSWRSDPISSKDMLTGSCSDRRSAAINRHSVALHLLDVQLIPVRRMSSWESEGCHYHACFEKIKFGSGWCQELSADFKLDIHFKSHWTNRCRTDKETSGRFKYDATAPVGISGRALDRDSVVKGHLWHHRLLLIDSK